jgi:hypothetical protein
MLLRRFFAPELSQDVINGFGDNLWMVLRCEMPTLEDLIGSRHRDPAQSETHSALARTGLGTLHNAHPRIEELQGGNDIASISQVQIMRLPYECAGAVGGICGQCTRQKPWSPDRGLYGPGA